MARITREEVKNKINSMPPDEFCALMKKVYKESGIKFKDDNNGDTNTNNEFLIVDDLIEVVRDMAIEYLSNRSLNNKARASAISSMIICLQDAQKRLGDEQ